jgi:hypothetical protein
MKNKKGSVYMKSAKFFICFIALSFSVLLIGIGFAQVTAPLSFTGNISFQHTGLYISNIAIKESNTVNIIGYSGTLVNLTAASDATMTITVTNPTGDTYYYLNHSAGSHNLTTSVKTGAPVEPGESITFTVEFNDVIAIEQIVRFNFTLVPPVLDEPNTNATGVLKLVIGEKSEKEVVGLNSSADKKTFEQWCYSGRPVLHYLDTNVSGNNLPKLFEQLKAQNVAYTLEWISETKYNIYLYSANDATKTNDGKYIITYKQEILYNTTEDLWYAADSFKGYAMVKYAKHGYGVQTENNKKVIWYANAAALPNGAEIVK